MPIASSDPTALDSLSKIRQGHVELMRQTLNRDATLNLVPTIMDFMRRVAEGGAHIGAEDDRCAAQSILDYWNATLLTSGAKKTAPNASTELTSFVQSPSGNQTSDQNPLQDISALGLRDRSLFYGREDAVASLVELLRKYPIVFITGSPASGRTSLAIAGVAAQLESRASDPRRILTLSAPGHDPIRALCDMVADFHKLNPKKLRSSPQILRETVDEACGEGAALVVADNVEELFTRCSDQSQREDFARAIASLAAEPLRHSVLLIVLDPWFDELSKLPALSPYAKADACYSPRPPTAAEIQRVLKGLATNAGMRMDPECVADLARDLQGDPAALALGRFMLLHLWPLAQDGFAGLDAYKRLGLPNEALARIAEQTYERLSERGKETAKRLFLALCRPDARHGTISQRESRRYLDHEGTDAAMDEALSAFSKAGLIRESEHKDNADDSIEIINDRLMTQWQRLAEWLEAKKDVRFRVLATAGLWDKSGRSPGYLFTDKDSIRDASKYLDSTPDTTVLGDFLDASKDALAKAKQRKKLISQIFLSMLIGIVILLSALVYTLWYNHHYAQLLINADIDELKAISLKERTGNHNDSELGWFEYEKMAILSNIKDVQGLGEADVDLSDSDIEHVDLRNFDNLRVINSKMDDIDLSSASGHLDLTHSAFNSSTISNADFSRSNLSFVQFRDAIVARTKFIDANLYRASFDDARLCDVDFAGASLKLATFWNTSFDYKTAAGLKNTAWWLAVGWTSRQVQDLLKQPRNDVDKSTGFVADRSRAADHVMSTDRSDNEIARAIALNDLAWTLAINGVDLRSNRQPEAKNKDSCGPDNENPRTAQDAAEKAICLIDHLESVDKESSRYASNRANFNDTLGYALLQITQEGGLLHSDQIDDALEHLTIGLTGARWETLFRLAVAEYAKGDSETALTDMRVAVRKGYVPTHERALLAKYLEDTDFGKQLNQELEELHPSRKNAVSCPADSTRSP